jgi:S1-C subfamily serine protease
MGPAAVVVVSVIIAVLLSSVVGFAAGFAGALLGTRWNPALPDRSTAATIKTSEPVATAAAAALSSVVNLDVSSDATAAPSTLPTGHPSVPMMQGSGSGVAFRKASGGGTYLLTNDHVVEGASKIVVTDTQGVTHTGRLVGTDPDTDIAVVEVKEALPLARIGDSDKLVVGQLAVAIGSPFGLQQSVTSGVISAIHRSISPASIGSRAQANSLVDVIQTDAAVNPGNSGGALVDRQGRLVGINSALYSNTGSSSGIGFAIPVNTAVRVADDIILTGKARHPFLGIEGHTVDAAVAAQDKLPVDHGAQVVSVFDGTGAKKAGVQAGDVIVKIGDTPVRTMEALIAAVRSIPIGTTVTVQYYRNGKLGSLRMTVGDRPPGK